MLLQRGGNVINNRSTLKTLEDFLMKARRRLHDENPDYSDADESQDTEGLEEFDPDNDGNELDDADKWLESHGKQVGEQEPEESAEQEQDEDESVPAEVQKPAPEAVSVPKQAQQPVVRPAKKMAPKTASTPIAADPLQPTRKELAQMREYTRPWEQRARDRAQLQAEPHVNPVMHHQGRLIEARNTSHADHKQAYEALTQSPDFQNADPITQMEMEDQFKREWHAQNPDHLKNALEAHNVAHKKGAEAMQIFNQVKDDKIRHIASGGAQPSSMSVEEGMQHVGGSREDEDSAPSGIQQDKGAAFAGGNKEFMDQYMQHYNKKARPGTSIDEYAAPEVRRDPSDVLGDHPALKDPVKQRQVNQFVARYHPQIDKAANHVLSKLGLSNNSEIDRSLLHFAGMHALFQAVNDYDHDHPSKAKFTTHLNHKLQGLMQSALKAQDEIPRELRGGAKKFDKKRIVENASPIKHTNKQGVTTIIQPPKKPVMEIAAAHPPDVQDRLQHTITARAPLVRKQAALQPKPAGPKINTTIIPGEDGDE
jgi:hypothetical protein